MPFPRWLARINLHITNRVLGPIASRSPGMAVVMHVGRKSQVFRGAVFKVDGSHCAGLSFKPRSHGARRRDGIH
jgi:hypothetical protein